MHPGWDSMLAHLQTGAMDPGAAFICEGSRNTQPQTIENTQPVDIGALTPRQTPIGQPAGDRPRRVPGAGFSKNCGGCRCGLGAIGLPGVIVTTSIWQRTEVRSRFEPLVPYERGSVANLGRGA
jgi:hypothetical protein